MKLLKNAELNTTREIQNMNLWHSNFCRFLNIIKQGFDNKVKCLKVIFWTTLGIYFIFGKFHWWIELCFIYLFLTGILHCGLRMTFFSLYQFTVSNFSLDFYFPFLFGLLFPFFIWSFIFPFPFFLWTFIQSPVHFGYLPIFFIKFRPYWHKHCHTVQHTTHW